jgi:hypothetical protein
MGTVVCTVPVCMLPACGLPQRESPAGNNTIVRGRYDGTYDKTNLPGELIMSNYFAVRDGKIVSLAVIRNQPSEYDQE